MQIRRTRLTPATDQAVQVCRVGANDQAYQTVLKELGALQNGDLPTNYLNNMSDAIRSAMNNTIGDTMNNLAQRGVLNSSVTDAAVNDIEKNISDTLGSLRGAKQCQPCQSKFQQCDDRHNRNKNEN